jgi:hypothetical protein
MGKHVVYLRAHDEAELIAKGHDPAEWVRSTIKNALGREPELFPEPPLLSAEKTAAPPTRREVQPDFRGKDRL